MLDGEVPYRDFELEYPPGALPVFLLPSLGAGERYDDALRGAHARLRRRGVVLVAFTPRAPRARRPRRLYGGVAPRPRSRRSSSAPSSSRRFDLWPAALVAAALAALVAATASGSASACSARRSPRSSIRSSSCRSRSSTSGAAAGWREALVCARRLRRSSLVVIFGAVPRARARRPRGQRRAPDRPSAPDREPRAPALLLAADRLGLYDATVVSSHGSQNLAGELPDALATAADRSSRRSRSSASGSLFARSEREPATGCSSPRPRRSPRSSRFGKVLSPQFLIWLLPLVPLVARPRGPRSSALFAAALVADAALVPVPLLGRRRDRAGGVARPPARDLLLVALVRSSLVRAMRTGTRTRLAARSAPVRAALDERRPRSARRPRPGGTAPGIPVRIRSIASSAFTPITESCGPVMPASVIAAVPPGRTRASFVWTCVCVPSTAVTRPSSMPRERDLLARRLGVEVDDDRRASSARASATSSSTTRNGWTATSRKSWPWRLITATGVPSSAGTTVEPAARRVRAAEVRRPEDPVALVEERDEVALAPDVVAGRDRRRRPRRGASRELRGQADPVGGVLAVHDAEVDLELLAQAAAGAPRRRGGRARRRRRARKRIAADALGRRTSEAAACTSRCTCWPASCV